MHASDVVKQAFFDRKACHIDRVLFVLSRYNWQSIHASERNMESIYWVISRDCNQKCPHCYNDSRPGAAGLNSQQVSEVVKHLPRPDECSVERVIISGGEVLVWPELLFQGLQELFEHFGDQTELWVQTNGDLLDEATLNQLLEANVSRIDIASMDKFHRKGSIDRREFLESLFHKHGLVDAERNNTKAGNQNQPPVGVESSGSPLTYAFWGANQDEWIGPLWPRGRALQKGLSKAGPEDEFCRNWSGAKNFLDYNEPESEVSIQLADVYPCCPMTCRPIGSLLNESLIAMLDRCSSHPVYQALNQGQPEAMGESLGISEEYGIERSKALGNHCLWCDEFFVKHAPDLLYIGGMTERGDVDLVQISKTKLS